MRLNRWLCSLLFIIGVSQVGRTQSDAFGLVFDDAAYQKDPLISTDSIRGGDLPWQVSLRQYCPIPGDQGSIPSCVGWALANALTIERAVVGKTNERSKINAMMHSVFFIYNQIKLGSCYAGAKLTDGIKLLQTQGDCLAKEFDASINVCAQQPNDKHRQLASPFAIKGFDPLFNEKNTAADDIIDAIRTMIARKKPVIVGVLVPDNFRSSNGQNINWKQTANGHAMVIVGYDDGKEQFEIMNSYGVNWGDSGFVWANYDDLARCVKYGYRLY